MRSLAPRSDLMVMADATEVTERPQYWVLRTRSNPNFYWGNYLLFKGPPTIGCLEDWESAFQRELRPATNTHRAFSWEHASPEAPASADLVSAFAQRGYGYQVGKVLTAKEVKAPSFLRSDVEVRPLTGTDDWQAQLTLSVAVGAPEEDVASFTEFAGRRVEAYRQRVESGSGIWFGAFADGRLLASAGLFWDASGAVGRFQSVATFEDVRRQGLCGTVVYRLSQFGLGQRNLRQLVMVADEDYHAARLYESMGFALSERHGEFLRRPELG